MRRRRRDFEADLQAAIGIYSVKPKAFVYVCECGIGCKVGVTDDALRRMNRLVRPKDELQALTLAYLRLYRRDDAINIEEAVRPILTSSRPSGEFRFRTDYYVCAPAVAIDAILRAEREIHAWPLAEYGFAPIVLWPPDPYLKPRPVLPREPIEFRYM